MGLINSQVNHKQYLAIAPLRSEGFPTQPATGCTAVEALLPLLSISPAPLNAIIGKGKGIEWQQKQPA
jgi:hypothetical protein